MATAKITLTYSTESNGDTSAKIKITMKYYGNGISFNNEPCTGTITFNGTTKSFTHTFTASTSAQTMGSAEFTVSKTHSSQTLKASGKFNTGVSIGTLTDTCEVPISAKTKYTIQYNANGGSGAPDNQTKWHGESLTLSKTKPTRTGYSFKNWKGSNGDYYASGATTNYNGNLTLTAQWEAKTYTVSYSANGGTGAPSSQTKTYGKTLTLSTKIPTRSGYTFTKWKASDGTLYSPGGSYTKNASTTMTAQWQQSTYTITYYPNGASGNAVTETKEHGKSYTIKSKFTRTPDWVFLGYSTRENATSATYSVGSTYNLNAPLKLYAVWRKTFKLLLFSYSSDIYDSSKEPFWTSQQNYTVYNKTTEISVTFPTNKPPAPNGYAFGGWSYDSETYSAGTTALVSVPTYNATVSRLSNICGVATWTQAYLAPKITSKSAYRCNANGAKNDLGDWGTFNISYTPGLKGTTTIYPAVELVKINDVEQSIGTTNNKLDYIYSNEPFTLSGIPVTTSCTIKVTLSYPGSDTPTTTTTVTITINAVTPIIDITPSGKGMGLLTPVPDNTTNIVLGSNLVINNHDSPVGTIIVKATPSSYSNTFTTSGWHYMSNYSIELHPGVWIIRCFARLTGLTSGTYYGISLGTNSSGSWARFRTTQQIINTSASTLNLVTFNSVNVTRDVDYCVAVYNGANSVTVGNENESDIYIQATRIA